MDRIEKLKEFLAANPNDNFLQHALALEYIKAGEEGEARRLFERILARDEDYVGSYYHLGKLLERTGLANEAVPVYQKGMQIARRLGDNHSYNELQAACDDLID